MENLFVYADRSIADQLREYLELDNTVYRNDTQLARIIECAGFRYDQ